MCKSTCMYTLCSHEHVLLCRSHVLRIRVHTNAMYSIGVKMYASIPPVAVATVTNDNTVHLVHPISTYSC